MGEPQRQLPDLVTLDEFFAITGSDDRHHELIEGQIVAMAPPMRAHATLVVTLAVALRAVLSEACDVLTEVGVVSTARAHTCYEVDLLVTCEPPEPRQRVIRAPVLLVEVLSPSTQASDRNRKLPDYRRLASAHEILFIDSEQMAVELYRRFDGARWLSELLRDPTDILHLDSVGLDLPLAELYRRVVFPAEDVRG